MQKVGFKKDIKKILQKRNELFSANSLKNKSFYHFIDKPYWMWFCTLNCKDKSNYNYAEYKLKEWRQLRYRQGIEIGYIGVWVRLPNPHIHLVMTGYNSNEILLDRSHMEWQSEWSDLTHKDAVIRVERERVLYAPRYITEKNMMEGNGELLIPYNLEKFERHSDMLEKRISEWLVKNDDH